MASETFCGFPPRKQKRPTTRRKIATLWDQGQARIVHITAKSILFLWDGIVWLNVHLVLIAEWLEKRFAKLARDNSVHMTVSKPQDLERGTIRDNAETLPEVMHDPLSSIVCSGPGGKDQRRHFQEAGFPVDPPTDMLSPQNGNGLHSQSPTLEAPLPLRYSVSHTMRKFLKKTSVSEQSGNDEESTSSFWKCRGQGKFSDLSSSEEQDSLTAPTQARTSSYTASDSEPSPAASDDSDDVWDDLYTVNTKDSSESMVTGERNAVKLPFPNRRLTFWDPKERLFCSRAIRPAGSQRKQSPVFRRRVSKDSLDSLTRYVAAYDNFVLAGADSRDKFKHLLGESLVRSGPLLSPRAFSGSQAAQIIDPEQPYVAYRPNQKIRAAHSDSNKPLRPRSLSVGDEPGRFSGTSLKTVYQYDPNRNEFLIRLNPTPEERPPTVIRNYVEVNARQIAQAQQKLVENYGLPQQ